MKKEKGKNKTTINGKKLKSNIRKVNWVYSPISYLPYVDIGWNRIYQNTLETNKYIIINN